MRIELVLKLAVLAAQIRRRTENFRQKDVRFLYEQLWNWQSANLGEGALRLHNTQIGRFLDGLVGASLARIRGRRPHPAYALTSTGVFSLVRSIRDGALEGSHPEFLLIVHFFSSYGERLLELANTQELRALVSVKPLLEGRKSRLEREIAYWKTRVREIQEVARDAKTRLAAHEPAETIVRDIARTHPYELGHQKSLMEVFDETDRPLMVWELVEGNHLRIKQLWEPRIRLLEAELGVLKRGPSFLAER